MTAEETATAKKGGIRIAIDWIDGDSDIDDAFRRSSPGRGVPPPSAWRKGSGKGDEPARSSHVRGGTRIHVDVCLTSPPSSARKLKGVFVDVRSSPDRGDDVCFVSPPPAVAKGKRSRDAAVEAEGEFFQGMSNDELGPDFWRSRLRPQHKADAEGEFFQRMSDDALWPDIWRSRLRPQHKAEARKRNGNAYSRSSADRPPAATKGKGKREVAAATETEVQFFSGMSNDALRRDIAMMSDGELRREIAGLRNNSTHLQFQQRLSEHRRRRILPLLEAEARRRQGSTRTQDGDDGNRGARTSTAC